MDEDELLLDSTVSEHKEADLNDLDEDPLLGDDTYSEAAAAAIRETRTSSEILKDESFELDYDEDEEKEERSGKFTSERSTESGNNLNSSTTSQSCSNENVGSGSREAPKFIKYPYNPRGRGQAPGQPMNMNNFHGRGGIGGFRGRAGYNNFQSCSNENARSGSREAPKFIKYPYNPRGRGQAPGQPINMNNFHGRGGIGGFRGRAGYNNFQKMDEYAIQTTCDRVKVHSIATDNEDCTHEVAIPIDMEFSSLRMMSTDPAKSYDFPLDLFQKEAIMCIENSQSVLVAAPSLAGKTVIASYAIAQCLREKQRVIYTSPLKADLIKRHNEFEGEFVDVGLMTGDVTLKPEASVLVMTIEILRSMLYRGSEVMREVGWVVFDEVDYMRHKERGVVCEETLILLPQTLHTVFLSASIPNARQFAEWICWLRKKPCHFVYTDRRPIPIAHFISPGGGTILMSVVNEMGRFHEFKFKAALDRLNTSDDVSKKGLQKEKRECEGIPASDLERIVHQVNIPGMIPCIIITSSKEGCDEYIAFLKTMDFNNEVEKETILDLLPDLMTLLSDEDKTLPQIEEIVPLLLRGIGVHHSGLIPVLRETIEFLFVNGFIKFMFATDDVFMDFNISARSVVIKARKYDGKKFRWITRGEYIQMAGRAGRRGKDRCGAVILFVDQHLSADHAKHIMTGAADPLNSHFCFTNTTILNLLRANEVKPESMLERSFYKFQKDYTIAGLEKRKIDGQAELAVMDNDMEVEFEEYFKMEKDIESLKAAIKSVKFNQNLINYLNNGRLLKIKVGNNDFDWGPLINIHKKSIPDHEEQIILLLEVLLCISEESATENMSRLSPPKDGERSVWKIVPVTIENIENVSTASVKIPDNMQSSNGRKMIERDLKDCLSRFNGELPKLELFDDMNIENEDLKLNIEKLEALENTKAKHALPLRNDFDKLKTQWKKKEEIRNEVEIVRTELKKAKSLLTFQMDDLIHRQRILKWLNYIDEHDVILDKGRFASEISSCDELLLTEMVFNGVFNDLNTGQVASLLSCFVSQENGPLPHMDGELSGCLRHIQEHARKIAKVSIECELEMDEDTYVDSFKAGLMEVVYNWVLGESFEKIMNNTDVFEGSIIRCILRVEDILRELVNAAKTMGNGDLERKINTASTALRRDIPFISLYL